MAHLQRVPVPIGHKGVWTVKNRTTYKNRTIRIISSFLIFLFLGLSGTALANRPLSSVGSSFPDAVGDFEKSDVVMVSTQVNNGMVIINIRYADDEIGMATGVGGHFSIDADQDPSTGGKDMPGFDATIMYNITQLAPVVSLEIHSGPNQGQTIPIGSNAGNNTRLTFNSRSVAFSFPASFIGNPQDFDWVLFSTGMFFTGDKWDRVPDIGIARCSTGKVVSAPVTGGGRAVAQNTIEPPRQAGEMPIVKRVTTRMEGDNAVWIIETNVNLPVNALDQYDSTHFHLLIDVDRRLETGITSGGIPFLAFGPDRMALCSLVPGAKASIRLVTGIRENGERITVGGSAGKNDLNCTFDRHTVKLTIPLWLIKAPSPEIDWLLISTRLNTKAQFFAGTSIAFDTGELRQPEKIPANAVIVKDPVRDAIIKEEKSRDGSFVGRAPIHKDIPNLDFTGAKAALTSDFLMLQITYNLPIALKPWYATAVKVHLPWHHNQTIHFSVNWSFESGGQVDMRDLSKNSADVTTHRFLNQCVAQEGPDVFLLIPVSVFNVQPLKNLELVMSSREIINTGGGEASMGNSGSYGGIMVKTDLKSKRQEADRMPDFGTIRLISN